MATPTIGYEPRSIPSQSLLLTVDVESYSRGLPPQHSHGGPPLGDSLMLLLDALADAKASATFFVLGDDADTIQPVLRRCVAEGHDVASHGMHHKRVDSLSRSAWKQDIRDSFALLQDIVQKPCRGYRAPWFSLSPEMPWVFDFLAEQGAFYDASLRLHEDESVPMACQKSGVVEVPVPLVRFGGLHIGILGGLLFRGLPRPMIRAFLASCAGSSRPACLYLHPYEWSATRTSFQAPLAKTLRRRFLTGRTLANLRWLAAEQKVLSIETWLRGRNDVWSHE